MKTFLIILAIVSVLAIIIAIILGEIFFTVGMRRSDKVVRISKRAKNTGDDKPLVEHWDMKKKWAFEHGAMEITQESFDGLKLRALLVENPGHSDKFCIICHGYTGHAAEMGFYAEKFYGKGFSILLPAARGHDISEGKYIEFGWPERKDICGWIDYINANYDSPQIVVYGVSMGAASVMMAVGEPLPENVKCAIEDCGYSSIIEQLKHSFKNMLKLPPNLLIWIGSISIRLYTGINIWRDGFATKQLAKCHIPMLFMHGTEDRFVPFEMLDKCYNAHPGPKEKLAIEGAVHASSAYTGGEIYWNKIFDFVNKYIDK
ncbi:MAG: alpha/beta hydrolase [Lachnospiraceae bacterium]|nr:alpha/beta hydrolase [Lachnospiraceae bacterium]